VASDAILGVFTKTGTNSRDLYPDILNLQGQAIMPRNDENSYAQIERYIKNSGFYPALFRKVYKPDKTTDE